MHPGRGTAAMKHDVPKRIFQSLKKGGTEGIILGRTEIPMIVKKKNYGLLLFGKTAIRARAAVDQALLEGGPLYENGPL
jgi:aspartate/glutamate racemase